MLAVGAESCLGLRDIERGVEILIGKVGGKVWRRKGLESLEVRTDYGIRYIDIQKRILGLVHVSIDVVVKRNG